MKKVELELLDSRIIRLASEFGPIGVRGLYYQLEGRGYIEKTKEHYKLVGRRLGMLRINGQIDWDLITDCSRNIQSAPMWGSVQDIMNDCIDQFKLNTWNGQEYRVQVWLEKEGLAPLLNEVIHKYRVPLYPAKGYTSLSFSRQGAIQAIQWMDEGLKVKVLQFGDYDPSGINIQESLKSHYETFGAGNVEMVRVGLNEDDIDRFDLRTRHTKSKDTRSKSFNDDRSVELDNITPSVFKKWVGDEIAQYIDFSLWNPILEEEDRQRKLLILKN